MIFITYILCYTCMIIFCITLIVIKLDKSSMVRLHHLFFIHRSWKKGGTGPGNRGNKHK